MNDMLARLDEVDDAVCVPAKAGDVIAFSSLAPHRTGANLVSGSVRKAYILQYAPDGAYTASLDLDGTDDDSIHVEVTVTIDGHRAVVDFAGTSPQIRQGLNCPINYTEAYTCYPLKCVLDPFTPRNEGSYRHVTVTAPNVDLLDAKTVRGDVHRAAIVAKSKG